MPLVACKYVFPLNNTGPGVRNMVEVVSGPEKTQIKAVKEQNIRTLKTSRYGRAHAMGSRYQSALV